MIKDPERRAELVEHLAELRSRLIRIIIYAVAGAILAWVFYDRLFDFIMAPLQVVLKERETKLLLTSIQEAFVIQMQVSIVAGIVVAAPFIVIELWGFVSPGLTAEEKRPLRWIAPLSVFLFACGASLCYLILPMGFKWFASYVPASASLQPRIQESILFTLKMMLAFGIVFELPVFLMLLAKVGLVNSRMLRDNWRYAMVLVSIVAAVATPSNDALTMLMMAVPVAMLYFVSIALVRIIEGKPKKQ